MNATAKKRVAILISGRGSNMQALIDACAAPEFPAATALVLSNKSNADGLVRAQAAGIATVVVEHTAFATREAFDAEIDRALRADCIDYICLAGFMRIFTDDFVRGWEGRILNIHPSLLPSFKGVKVHAQALAAGVTISGCTVHYVVPELDSGPIVAQAAVPVLPGDSEATLAARILKAEHTLYPLALRAVISGQTQTAPEGAVLFSPI